MADGNDLFKLYRYEPSMAAAVIFVVLFLIITAIHTYQMIRTRTWFFIPFLIGGFFEWIGYVGRAVSSSESPDWTVRPYVVQTLLLLVSPALFAASIYMILGRIILLTNGEVHSIIRRQWLTKLFVLGDVVSFVMQGAGGGIMAAGTVDALKNGEHIVIGGLVVQIVVFSLFVVTAGVFQKRMRSKPTNTALNPHIRWQLYLYVLYGVSLLIMVRSVFRLIEYAQGNDGYLMSHEVFLYIFDGILMLAAMVLMAWYHPSEINSLLKGSQTKVVRNFVSVYSLD